VVVMAVRLEAISATAAVQMRRLLSLSRPLALLRWIEVGR
jgi:hypothetical protein